LAESVISEAAEFRFTSRFLIDAILVDSGLRDYEINVDRRFSAEIRVLSGFHAYPANRFICKTGTEQHTTGPADFLRKFSGKNSGKNRPDLHGRTTAV
jgi:hypothetical protein